MEMKYLLAQMAIQKNPDWLSTFGPGGDTAYLANLWTAVGQQMPADQRVDVSRLTTPCSTTRIA